MSEIKKVVLAYSGGLDTSIIIPWLKENYNNPEIIAVAADVGQGDELEGLEEKAIKTGASKLYIEDLTDEMVDDVIVPSMMMGAKYEEYLLGTAFARPIIAKRLVEIAKKEGADAICHGCTGKGNDQVRFELGIKRFAPEMKIIAPWREWDIKGRDEEIDYAEAHNVPLKISRETNYSKDKNLWHLSHEGLDLEDPANEPQYDKPGFLEMGVSPAMAPDKATYVTLDFEKGWPVAIDGEKMKASDIIRKLNKLGGDQWQKAKAKAKAAAKDLAQGLIQLYAARKRLPGYAFSADTPWQNEFEESFEYTETDDQLRCIAEIKQDMESPTPMDRLLCGDVGFGKTEVALRAAMKAILDGKQVAILVPTTVLAQQHYVTAMKRFSTFPVNIDVLSRFRTASQQKKTLYDLSVGKVDLIIGTHKLLQKGIQFKDLGLLIVDEEQRFGVTHKERLKELSKGVDVLTLSATPIPRTLNMALSGLRDMSTIEEPPGDRYPVQTFVLEHDDRLLDDAIRRELDRGGQVYYLHNRVESIDQTAARLKARHPGAEIAVAHGKMNEEQLGDVMQRMADGEIQILVCTTIIETGIDIPNVNTLIIEDADKLGLAQLHQIRGRVGRSSRHAFAYLTFRRGKVLSEVAEKRLNAIREFAEFGSGFKIAMRDLEIRGAGDLLGAEQSGHMMSVGYDMYLKLLEDAVLEEQGGQKNPEPECTADLSVTANISKTYVPSGEQRMDLYRRMAAIRSEEDSEELLDEIVDRYGDPPKGVMNLVAIALLRAKASAAGICKIEQKADTVTVSTEILDFPAVSAVCAEPEYKGRSFFSAGEKPMLSLKLKKGEDPLKATQELVKHYGEARSN